MNIAEGISRVTGGRVRFQAETSFSAVRRYRETQDKQRIAQEALSNPRGDMDFTSLLARKQLEGTLVDLNRSIARGPGIKVEIVIPVFGKIPLYEARRDPLVRSERVMHQELARIAHDDADRLAVELGEAGEARETYVEAIEVNEEAARI